MTTEPCPDNHRQLQFGSGDYYLFCHSCGRTWMLKGDRSSTQPEYSYSPSGKLVVGADASKQTPFVGAQIRVRAADFAEYLGNELAQEVFDEIMRNFKLSKSKVQAKANTL